MIAQPNRTRPGWAMSTLVVDGHFVHVPGWVVDLTAFRRWFSSDEFPETGRICFLNGEVWVDMSKEQVFSHNQVKNEFNIVLGGLVKAGRLGRFLPDGILLTNVEANLSSQLDATFVSYETLRSGRIRLEEGTREGYLELAGTPDLV